LPPPFTVPRSHNRIVLVVVLVLENAYRGIEDGDEKRMNVP
jgi:hypothetical protein